MINYLGTIKNLAVFALFVFSFSSQASEALLVDYVIEKQDDRYFIDVTFQAPNSEKTLLSMPLKWANANTAHKGVRNLTVLSSDAELVQEADTFHITHKPMAKVALRYQLLPVAESTLDPTETGYTLPIFQENYIHWIGITSLVLPYINDFSSEAVSVTLATKGFDNHFPFYSSLTKQDGKYQFQGSNANFLSSIFVAGDYRLVTKTTKYGQLSLAIRGEWTFDDESLFQSLVKIYSYQREYWNETDTDNLWVALTPLNHHENPYVVQSNGIALHKSFTSFFTQNLKQDNINYLFAHEGFHNWLPKKFGGLSGPPQTMSWFSEGFTNFLTNELLLAGGMINDEQHKLELEKAYRKVNESEFKNLSNAEQAKIFFRNSLIPDVIYARGMVLAHIWDLDIRLRSSNKLTLRDMLRSLQNEQTKSGQPLTRQLIEEHAMKFGASNAQFQSFHILDGMKKSE